MITKQKTILVTGASGMLGLKLCEILEDRGFNVIKKQFDISSAKTVSNFSKKIEKLDCIVHCAAITDVNQCELHKKSCYAVNVIGTRNMVNMAKHFNSNIIYISTPMIFSGTAGNYKETSKPQPLNYYAKTKLLGEKEILKYKRGLVLRANPIGVRPPGSHLSFIQWFVNAAENNSSFSLFTDVRINPISTTTLSGLIADLILDFKKGTLHLGSHDIANKADVWRIIVSKFPKFSGKVVELSVDDTKAGKIAERPKEMWLNVDKAKTRGLKMPGWKTELNTVLRDLRIV